MKIKNKEIINKVTIDKYRSTLKGNILDIESILRELEMKNSPPISIFKNILIQSSEEITQKWLLGKKYCRTYFINKAFGSLYPNKYLDLSLSIDAMINILDDLLDESLEEKTKTNYIIEFLRVSSVLYRNPIPEKIQKALKIYFEKLITLAVTEQIYQEQIKKEKRIDKVIQDSVDLLICRATDIDVFTEIGLVEFSNKKLAEKIKKLARLFRAINILKKDIGDIEHDKKNNIDTIVTLMYSRGEDSFIRYINGVADSIVETMKPTMKQGETTTPSPIYKFKQAIRKEREIIKKTSWH